MTAVRRSDAFRYPEGVGPSARVVANARHAKAYRSSPRGRKGTVTAPCAAGNQCYVLWDGTQTSRPVHRNHFDVLPVRPRAAPEVSARPAP
jgi:hypothetical protein